MRALEYDSDKIFYGVLAALLLSALAIALYDVREEPPPCAKWSRVDGWCERQVLVDVEHMIYTIERYKCTQLACVDAEVK